MMDLLATPTSGRKGILMTFVIFFVSLLVIYSLMFIIPSATEVLLLDQAKLFSGEFWRLFTYQFVHDSISHLVENIFALFLSVLLAIELKAAFSDYSVTYFSSGVLAIIPMWLLLPFTALGASTAVYGSFGFLSRSASRFHVKPYALLLLVTGLTLASSVYTYYSTPAASLLIIIQQAAAHLSGLFFGYFFSPAVALIKERYPSKRLSCLKSTA